ncbi:hypothetical protein OC846_002319 [Tilletia horrida]|uniref:Fork-head domain-containing protein n=1 Tax=Tilletia horrida TaxID=155126 RepID=A0AAN6GX92_9BASI|nr:hypothetical protein OC846_002319 [Tilletia horrida]KAK0567474.1 hypothetical protein OC861_002697 [Tilletia horrida]
MNTATIFGSRPSSLATDKPGATSTEQSIDAAHLEMLVSAGLSTAQLQIPATASMNLDSLQDFDLSSSTGLGLGLEKDLYTALPVDFQDFYYGSVPGFSDSTPSSISRSASSASGLGLTEFTNPFEVKEQVLPALSPPHKESGLSPWAIAACQPETSAPFVNTTTSSGPQLNAGMPSSLMELAFGTVGVKGDLASNPPPSLHIDTNLPASQGDMCLASAPTSHALDPLIPASAPGAERRTSQIPPSALPVSEPQPAQSLTFEQMQAISTAMSQGLPVSAAAWVAIPPGPVAPQASLTPDSAAISSGSAPSANGSPIFWTGSSTSRVPTPNNGSFVMTPVTGVSASSFNTASSRSISSLASSATSMTTSTDQHSAESQSVKPQERERGMPFSTGSYNTSRVSISPISGKRLNWSDMICQTIAESPDGRLVIQELFERMIAGFPEIREWADNKDWEARVKNRIKSTLSIKGNLFVKVPRPSTNAGKGSWWMLTKDASEMWKSGRVATAVKNPAQRASTSSLRASMDSNADSFLDLSGLQFQTLKFSGFDGVEANMARSGSMSAPGSVAHSRHNSVSLHNLNSAQTSPKTGMSSDQLQRLIAHQNASHTVGAGHGPNYTHGLASHPYLPQHVAAALWHAGASRRGSSSSIASTSGTHTTTSAAIAGMGLTSMLAPGSPKMLARRASGADVNVGHRARRGPGAGSNGGNGVQHSMSMTNLAGHANLGGASPRWPAMSALAPAAATFEAAGTSPTSIRPALGSSMSSPTTMTQNAVSQMSSGPSIAAVFQQQQQQQQQHPPVDPATQAASNMGLCTIGAPSSFTQQLQLELQFRLAQEMMRQGQHTAAS